MSSGYHCPNCDHDYPNSMSVCPYCGTPKGGGTDIGETEPIPPTEPLKDDGKTDIYKPPKDMAITPVVGWLVCTEGADRGKDFRLHVDNNFVGRDSDQDVRLKDKAVSRQRHFSVAYDRECDNYFVTMGGGTGIVRVNGMPLGGGLTYLEKGDKIRVGGTTLVFIPLETAYVKWEWK